MKVAGRRSAKYFSWSDTSAPARVARLEIVDLIHTPQVDTGGGRGGADGVDDVGDVGAAGQLQAEETGELHGEHPGGCGRGDGDVDDPPGRGPAAVAAAREHDHGSGITEYVPCDAAFGHPVTVRGQPVTVPEQRRPLRPVPPARPARACRPVPSAAAGPAAAANRPPRGRGRRRP